MRSDEVRRRLYEVTGAGLPPAATPGPAGPSGSWLARTGKALRLGANGTVGLALVLWFFFFRPEFLGGPAGYIIVSGNSMEPTYRSGDLVVVRRQENYEVGDIVAYRIPRGEPGEGIIVIHRVVGGSSQEGLVTKGDNRQGPDLWRPTAADVVGKAWIHVPGGGRILAFLRSPLVVATLAGGLAFVLVLMAGRPQARTNSDRGPWAAGR